LDLRLHGKSERNFLVEIKLPEEIRLDPSTFKAQSFVFPSTIQEVSTEIATYQKEALLSLPLTQWIQKVKLCLKN